MQGKSVCCCHALVMSMVNTEANKRKNRENKEIKIKVEMMNSFWLDNG